MREQERTEENRREQYRTEEENRREQERTEENKREQKKREQKGTRGNRDTYKICSAMERIFTIFISC